ncbi:hypothetical protein MOQ_003275 [Trypanosoma cruzi marinkellei]|uniref:Uncharacterized protein n=1 Tax=Trypanosoma cruzi marinkellei TaxID=85056 RepID=K2N0E7_TRYCR|nr:hypothetical protein MOQ_003275 [Trypanosoma cruzi marinkellei]
MVAGNGGNSPQQSSHAHSISHASIGEEDDDGFGAENGELIDGEEYSSIGAVLSKFVERVRRTHPSRIAWVVFLIFLVTSGNAMQVIGLNFWLRSFPKDGAPGNFTTLAVSSLLFGLIFLLMLVVYIIVAKPSLAYLRCACGWRILFLIGLADAVNSYMAIYAASHTPEVLQALFTSLVPVYAAGFTKWILEDMRSYWNVWILTSFFLIVSGVVVASAYHFAHGFGGDSKEKAWWSLIFFFSVPPTVLMNIWQNLYMIQFTHDPSPEESNFSSPQPRPRRGSMMFSDSVKNNDEKEINADRNDDETAFTPCETTHAPENSTGERHRLGEIEIPSTQSMQGTDTVVKLVMLACGTTIQFILIMFTLPMDAIPWWGGSKSVNDAWINFSEGIRFLFHSSKNSFYCMVYTLGFLFTYIGSAYLNQYSVTLCSMIGQLSSPFTALLLIIVPKWNLEKGYTPWYLSLLAIVFLCVGSFIYTLWEEKTDEEKRSGEQRLKEKLMLEMQRSALTTRLRSNSTFIFTAEE